MSKEFPHLSTSDRIAFVRSLQSDPFEILMRRMKWYGRVERALTHLKFALTLICAFFVIGFCFKIYVLSWVALFFALGVLIGVVSTSYFLLHDDGRI